MKKTCLLLLSLVLLGGCKTTEGYRILCDSWIGEHSDKLLSIWGPPQNEYPLSDGGKVLEYIRTRNVQTGGYSYQVPQTTIHQELSPWGLHQGTSTTYVEKDVPVQNLTFKCITRFTVDEVGIIKAWSFEGNDCKALPPSSDASYRTKHGILNSSE